MKLKKGLTLGLWVLVAILVVSTAVAQETTAGLQGSVKDPQGAVVAKAVVEVSGEALIGVKKIETDASGYYRFANLPPGAYTITVTAQGFRTLKQTGLRLEVGKLPTIDLKLEIGGVEQTIEVSSAAPLVDVTQSKVQTTVTSDVINAVPKGRSFQSLIQFAPGARTEVLQNGYQIDGATNSENSYLVEGQETASIRTGATTMDVPIEFIQEVQIKTSGFEAEFGGALGGVVNVIQKRGSNAWHGSVFTSYRGDMFNAAASSYERKDPNIGATHTAIADCPNAGTGPNCRLDSLVQYYQPAKDHYRTLDPGFEVGGYILKDRLWLFTSFAPDFSTLRRTVQWHQATPVIVAGPRSFNQDIQTYFGLSRVDYLVTQKIRLYGTWQLGYQRVNGNALPNADSANGLKNSTATQSPDNFNYGIGYVAPNTIYGTGADITLTPSLIATTRYGYTFEDYQDRGLPIGIRYMYRNSNYAYGGVPGTAATTSLTGAALPSQFVNISGYATLGANSAYIFDKYKRQGFSQDLAYFKKGFGTHNFKFGYGFYKLSNSTLNGYNTAQAYIAYATPYKPLPSNYSTCATISAQNIALYGSSGVSASDTTTGTRCMGLWGTVNYREYGESGDVSSMNHSLYLQDAWTIGSRLTLNVGYRLDKEHLPSYAPGLPGIDFGFSQKAAPRLGGSYDLLGNGKLKLYGSFGYFYDIMKYELPRGSFGGNYWHDCVYALDTPDWTSLVPTRGSNGHFCNPSGGANGTFPAGSQRFIENQNYRTSSNDPNQPGAFSSGLIDPNLKPMKQHEMVFGADWALSPKYAFEARYSRKRLDTTIEDAGVFTPDGEQYYIVNPGMGIDVQPIPTTDCTDCQTQPKARRDYDGLELRLVRRPGTNWGATISYTYSKLRGNYAGLTSTDISDSGIGTPGRASPNVDRNFDEPYMQFDAHGRLQDGPLPTDRPNTFKAYGYYRVKWFGHETLIGAYQQVYSGIPLSSYMNVEGAPVFIEGRGKFVTMTRDANTGNWVVGSISEKRGPMFAQTDLNLVQDFHVSKKNEKLVLGFEANVLNVLNHRAATLINQEVTLDGALAPDIAANVPASSVSGLDYHTLMHGYNYTTVANSNGLTLNSAYGKAYTYQAGRQMRFKIRFSF